MATETKEQKVEEKVIAPAKSSEENPNEASEKSEASQLPDKTDIDNVLMILNEVDQISGGNGGIKSIPDELHGSVKFLVEKMVTLRDAFEDPLFKDVLDDMLDQRQDGQTPSLLVAIARNVPMEELQEIADEEGYEDVQNAVKDRVSKEKEENEAEEKLYGNFEKTKQAIDEYCAENGYGDKEKQRLYSTIKMLMNVFADGFISKEEVSKIDKIERYDEDMEMMKSKLPAEPVKTVLPDKASMQESMAGASKPATNAAPKNSLESMAQNMYTGTDVTEIGKRKRQAFK
ncbi:MAG: hypothetical protein LLF95_11210 [Bacteroidales bacterium]|nr:hypothetical protein [Bacteroidales bacterium]